MKHLGLRAFLAMTALLLTAQAQALMVSPADCNTTLDCDTGGDPSQAVISQYIFDNYGVTDIYKQNVGEASDVGAYAGSYETTFTNTPSDPADALIAYTGGPAIDCSYCFLLVKGGNATDIAWYLFDLSGIWDGMEDIQIKDFWSSKGAISHVSIYGDETTTTPEPGMLALLGLGLTGFVIARRKNR